MSRHVEDCLSPQNVPSTELQTEDKNLLITPTQTSVFICPVCSASLSLSTEETMSRHVEDCLSRQEVAAIVKEEEAVKKVPNQPMGGGKRKLADIGTVIPKK